MKKPHKHDTNLQNNSTLYFQVGLILTLLASYGLLEMNFERKIWVLPNPQIVDTEAVCFVNIVPEVIPEPITETKVEPIRKKLLAINFTSINDNSQIVVNPEDIFTEQLEVPSLNLIPEDLNVYELEEPIDEIFSIVGLEQVPIYPGCEDLYTNAEHRGCMSEKIARLIQRKFNTDLASILGLSGKQFFFGAI